MIKFITGLGIGLAIGMLAMYADCHSHKQTHWHTHSVVTDEPTPEVTANRVPSFIEVEMNVSAYCPCEKCCGEWADGATASGVSAKGKLIAAPRIYGFDTKMDIPGYGVALVLDRGGAIKGNKIDLLFPTHQEALNWGRQYLTVKVYKTAGE
jgi:3D (Asp-Asp-Asp) domain-containing protein